MTSDASRCPWLEGASSVAVLGPESLPVRADVVVVGGGLAGVAASLFLAEAGVSVVLLESRGRLGAGASGRQVGQYTVTALPEHPHRLEKSLGMDKTRELLRVSRENRALMEQRLGLQPTGGLWLAMDAREPGELESSAEVLGKAGVPVELWDADRVNAALRSDGFGGGLYLPEEGGLEPMDAVERLAAAALAQGVSFHTHCSVTDIDRDALGIRVQVGKASVHTDAMIFAAEASLPQVDATFRKTIFPVREHAIALPGPPGSLPIGGRAQYGYAGWRQAADGTCVFSGCRWATPHMEAGETDDETVEPKVIARIDAFRRARFPQLADVEPTWKWSWITAHTCDGLPLIGPLPGSPDWVICAGFSGYESSLALRAASAVTEGLLTGYAKGIPAWLAPSRLV